MGRSIHRRLTANPWEGTSLLKFVFGRIYNGKLARRYGHAPTDACPLCKKSDSCTHIAGKCSYHKALTISRHNATCQVLHAAIWKFAKGEGALHSAPDLVPSHPMMPPTSEGTRMSHVTQYIFSRASLHYTTMLSARRHPTGYLHGYY